MSNKQVLSNTYKAFEEFWSTRKPKEAANLELLDYLKSPSVAKIMDIGSSAIFVFNYASLKYEFMSESIQNLTGYPAKDFLEQGMEFTFRKVLHPNNREATLMLYQEGIKYFEKIQPARQLQSKSSFDYKIQKANGDEMRVLQNSQIVQHTSDGKPILDIGVLTDITHWKTSNNNLFLIKEPFQPNKIWVYDNNKQKMTDAPISITKSELRILKLLVEGIDNDEIGKRLCVSPHTVHTHKKNMMKKIGFGKITELINFSVICEIV